MLKSNLDVEYRDGSLVSSMRQLLMTIYFNLSIFKAMYIENRKGPENVPMRKTLCKWNISIAFCAFCTKVMKVLI